MANQQEILQQANTLIAQNNVEDALSLLETTLKQNPQMAQLRIELAKLKALLGDEQGVNLLANEALRQSLSPESYLLKGMACAMSGDYSDAIKFYELALSQNDRLTLAYTNLGIALRELGYYSRSESTLKHAKKLDSKNPEITYHLAQTLVLQLKIKEAIDELISTIKINPTFMPAYLALAAIYIEGKNTKDAKELYKLAIKSCPTPIEAMRCLANLHLYLGEISDSIKLWKTITTTTKFRDDYMQLGCSAIAAKDFQLAEQAFLEVLKQQKENWHAYYNLAEVYDVLGLDDRASQAYLRAMHYSQGNYKPYNGYGLYLLKHKQVESAVDHLIEAYELSENEPEPAYNLALAFVEAGRLDDAKQVLEESLEAKRLGSLESIAQELLNKLMQV